MGQYGMVIDKRTPYEHDIRIPYFVRVGKNLKQARLREQGASASSALASNVDVAPTLIDLAAGSPAAVPASMDGESWAGELGLARPAAAAPPPPPPAAAAAAAAGAGAEGEGGRQRRQVQLIEYWGNSPGRFNFTAAPGEFHTPPHFTGYNKSWCVLDAPFNTFACLRSPPVGTPGGSSGEQAAGAAAAAADSIFCQWFDTWEAVEGNDVSFEEFYDIAADPFQLSNAVAALPAAQLAALRAQLRALRVCKGVQCGSQ
jgi:N-acetylglucosamine-6-sulfatase